MSSVPARLAMVLTLTVVSARAGPMAMTVPPVTLAGLTASAGRIFRGVCLSAEVGTVEYAGARIAATTYTFDVRESLKGGGDRTVTFRQVGTPGGGARDLGRAAGLPVYAPGGEYVIFLLPESKARLTSPAGASRGALRVSGEHVVVPPDLAGLAPTPLRDPHAEPAPRGEGVPYRSVRAAILASLGGAPPGPR